MAQFSNCGAMAQVIQKQQAEIARLRKVIVSALSVCNQITTESSRVMAQHGSPYKYNLAKGARDAATEIEKRLRGN
jgi:hypothetical protein